MAEEGWRKGPWTTEEDRLLIQHVKFHGEGRWNSVSTLSGLKRNGKSCRLRWVNYLRPDLKRGQITPYEEKVILELHALWGNRWSTIARSLPGRTDNEIKNYWRTHFKKKGNPTLENSDKAKARLLRRQQFQQQLLQKQQNTQVAEMKRIISLLDENETHFMKQEQASPIDYATDTNEDLGFFYSMFYSYATVLEDTNPVTMGDGLWNFDDVNGVVNYPIATNTVTPLPTSVTPSC